MKCKKVKHHTTRDVAKDVVIRTFIRVKLLQAEDQASKEVWGEPSLACGNARAHSRAEAPVRTAQGQTRWGPRPEPTGLTGHGQGLPLILRVARSPWRFSG